MVGLSWFERLLLEVLPEVVINGLLIKVTLASESNKRVPKSFVLQQHFVETMEFFC